MRINSVHNSPVHVASVGHARVKIITAGAGPVALDSPGPKETGRARRQRTKAAVRARRDEVARGAGFLERLTLTRPKGGS
jgi:hypothetical protein